MRFLCVYDYKDKQLAKQTGYGSSSDSSDQEKWMHSAAGKLGTTSSWRNMICCTRVNQY